MRRIGQSLAVALFLVPALLVAGCGDGPTDTPSNDAPTATITAPADGTTFEVGTSVTFRGSGSDPEDGALTGGSLVWTSSLDGQLGTGASVTTSNLSLGTHTITLRVTDSQGVTGRDQITVTVESNDAPTATITAPASGTRIVVGTSLTFEGEGNDPEDGALTGASLVWTSDLDGQIGTGTSVSTSTLSVGTHVVTLTATDSGGATGTDQIAVIVDANDAPTATITAPADGTTVESGTSVSFAGTGSDPEDGALTGASLVWTSDLDGQIGTGTSVSTSGLSVGTHVITLTATDSQGATGTDQITLTVDANDAPTATITAPADGTSVESGILVSFAGTGSDPEDGALTGGSLVWTSDLDGQIGTGTSVTTSGLSVGTHTITLTATDSQGLTDTDQITVTITPATNDAPTAIITAPADGTSVESGSSVTFQGTGSDPEDGALTGGSLVWSSDLDGQLGTGTSVTTSGLSVGTHTITLTATDSEGAGGIDQITLTVTPGNQAPTADITAPASGTSVAVGTSVTFDGTGTDPEDGALTGGSLVWTSNLDGQFGTGTSVTTSSLSVGTHTITLRARDAQGATGTDQITLTVTNDAPTADITAPADGTSVAVGSSVTFEGTGNDPEDGALTGASLVWSSDLDGQIGTGASVTTSSLSAGTHAITLTATDSQGATGTDQITLTVTNDPPTATITAPASGTSVAFGASVTFDGTGSDPEDGALTGASLVWSSDLDGQIGTGTSVTTSSLSAGTHTITLTATDSQGATGTDQITLTVTNDPPTASITAPADGTSVESGVAVTFDGTGSDPEEGALTGGSLVWTSNLDGQFGTGTSVTTSGLSVGTHTITLTATDSQGATGTDQISVTVTAAAAGIPVEVGATASSSISVGGSVSLPVTVDPTNSGGENVASVSIELTWDPAVVSYVSVSGGGFDTFVPNDGQVASGTFTAGAFSFTGTTAEIEAFTIELSGAAVGQTTVQVTVTAIGNETGDDLSSLVTTRDHTVTVTAEQDED